MMFIFVLALVLFGPNKLPEIGRTIGKAIAEFRRASDELKTTFEREMKGLEQETDIKQIADQFHNDTYNYDYSSYETTYEGAYGSESYDSTNPPTASASAPEGAESSSVVAPEGTVAQGAETSAVHEPNGGLLEPNLTLLEPAGSDTHSAPVSTTTEHNA